MRDGDMRRVGLALLLVGAGLVARVAPAGAVAPAAGSRPVRPAVTGGGVHSCALLPAGTVECWGRNYFGQLGDGTNTNSSIPIAVSGLDNAVAIATGGAHSCALVANGTVKCWGYNGCGGLGNGTTTNSSTPV